MSEQFEPFGAQPERSGVGVPAIDARIRDIEHRAVADTASLPGCQIDVEPGQTSITRPTGESGFLRLVIGRDEAGSLTVTRQCQLFFERNGIIGGRRVVRTTTIVGYPTDGKPYAYYRQEQGDWNPNTEIANLVPEAHASPDPTEPSFLNHLASDLELFAAPVERPSPWQRLKSFVVGLTVDASEASVPQP